ncbi:MAG: RNA-binding protein [Candidatus Saccharimonadales bacterium]
MATKLYVGGLAYSVNDQELEEIFKAHGNVTSAVVIKDRDSGQSKGFGFVEFAEEEDANNAIKALNEQEVSGRKIIVNLARPQENRPRGGGGGGGGYNNNRGGGGGGGYRNSY